MLCTSLHRAPAHARAWVARWQGSWLVRSTPDRPGWGHFVVFLATLRPGAEMGTGNHKFKKIKFKKFKKLRWRRRGQRRLIFIFYILSTNLAIP